MCRQRSRTLRLPAALRVAAATAALLTALLVWAPAASAHVLVFPDQVPPRSFTLFTVVCPDERGVALTGLQLAVPAGLVIDSIEPSAGFRAQIVRDQTERAIGLRWTGGRVAPGQMATLRFTALAPSHPDTIRLPAVQTFADGSTQVWHTAAISVVPSATGGGSNATAWIAVGIASLAAVLALAALVVAVRLSQRPRTD